MEKNQYLENLIRIVKGSILAIGITMIALLIFAIILTYTDISENYIYVGIIVVTAISILLGGIISTKQIKKRGFLYGMLVGVIYMLTLYILSGITGSGFQFSTSTVIMFGSAITAGIIGGIIGVNIGK